MFHFETITAILCLWRDEVSLAIRRAGLLFTEQPPETRPSPSGTHYGDVNEFDAVH